MKELLRTNNAVYLSFAQLVLAEAGIDALIFDTHMSIMEGSLGVLPRRLMVADEDLSRARAVLAAAEPPAVEPDEEP
jgi:hypothetical protein